MEQKFIRAFIYGIEENETINVIINGKEVVFTVANAQQDIEISISQSDTPSE